MQIKFDEKKWQITATLDEITIESLNQYNHPSLYEDLFNPYKLKIEMNQFDGLIPKVNVNLNGSELVLKIIGPSKIEDIKGKKYQIPQLTKEFPENYIEFI